jgi:hypothetical protein
VAAAELVDEVVAVAAGAWASGAAVLGPSSSVTSLRNFGVMHGLSLDQLIRPDQ